MPHRDRDSAESARHPEAAAAADRGVGAHLTVGSVGIEGVGRALAEATAAASDNSSA
ncbi:hypothetical protein [Edaphobacter aggregans]|uniref:hypothetical protein n=1 Tax=Edaphobacter aggregans TaxID=570835 RepID=UPI00163B5C00|nr:hypothetical protein [Edaphobacter aggregans]